jgi:hypothetical protein
MHGIARSLNRLAAPHFLSLKEHEELVAAAVCSRKTVRVGENTYHAFWRTLQAVNAPKIRHGYGRLMAEQSRRHFLREVGIRGLLQTA